LSSAGPPRDILQQCRSEELEVNLAIWAACKHTASRGEVFKTDRLSVSALATRLGDIVVNGQVPMLSWSRASLWDGGLMAEVGYAHCRWNCFSSDVK
jgi:hypothetical protein